MRGYGTFDEPFWASRAQNWAPRPLPLEPPRPAIGVSPIIVANGPTGGPFVAHQILDGPFGTFWPGTGPREYYHRIRLAALCPKMVLKSSGVYVWVCFFAWSVLRGTEPWDLHHWNRLVLELGFPGL